MYDPSYRGPSALNVTVTSRQKNWYRHQKNGTVRLRIVDPAQIQPTPEHAKKLLDSAMYNRW